MLLKTTRTTQFVPRIYFLKHASCTRELAAHMLRVPGKSTVCEPEENANTNHAKGFCNSRFESINILSGLETQVHGLLDKSDVM